VIENQQANEKESYFVRLTAKKGELAADANGQLNPGGNCHMCHWAINSNYCWAVESWVKKLPKVQLDQQF